MSFWKRLRFLGGILFVSLLLICLTAYLTYTMTHVRSSSATLKSDSYAVGTDYSGVILKQYIEPGDHVKTGQQLFLIKSSLLNSDLTSGSLKQNDIAFSVDKQNNIILKATVSGTVADVSYLEGSFVPANKEIANIRIDNSAYVEAYFKLAPPDYARLHDGDLVVVTLPNNQHVNAAVNDISVSNTNGATQTIVKARLQGSASGIAFSDGTPVSAELHLSGKNFYNTWREVLNELIQPKG